MRATVLELMMVIPLGGAVVETRLRGRALRAVAVLVALVVAALAVWVAIATWGTTARKGVLALPWLAIVGETPSLGVMLDPLSSVLLLVAAIIGLLTVLYSTAYLGRRNRERPTKERDQARYYFWLLLFVGAMVGVALAPNFLQLLLFWELTTLCSWGLISYRHHADSLRAGFKALLMTHVGGLFLVGAVLLLVARTGSFEFDALRQLSGTDRAIAFSLLLVAALAKAAQVPVHTWLPDAMVAPTPVSAYLHAAAMVKAGVYLLARSVMAGWAMPPVVAAVLGATALVTILFGLSCYFAQDDLKRLLAYSTIVHLGYITLGLALGAGGSVEAFRGSVLHIICHGFSKATLFLCVGSVAYITGTRRISELRGLARAMPLTATAFFVGVLSVAGVPPLACFWSKFMILAGALTTGGGIGPLLFVVLLGETLLGFAWMLYVAQRVFLGSPSAAAEVHSEPPLAMSAAVVLLMIGCVVAPWIGMPFVEQIGR